MKTETKQGMPTTNRRDQHGQQIIPCKMCGDDTTYSGTQLCDRCWELENRIKASPGLALQVLVALDKEHLDTFRAVLAPDATICADRTKRLECAVTALRAALEYKLRRPCAILVREALCEVERVLNWGGGE